MSKLTDAIGSIPRAAKWGIAAACAFGLYFLVIERVIDRTNFYALRADKLDSNLQRVTDLESPDSVDGALLLVGRRTYGVPQLPTDSAARPEAIHRVVDEVLEEHGIDDRTKTEKSLTLTADRLSELTLGEGRVERYIVEVSFEATQETVARVIADLEQSPVITVISRVKIDRVTAYAGTREPTTANSGPKLVRAAIAAETWVRVRGGSGNGGEQ